MKMTARVRFCIEQILPHASSFTVCKALRVFDLLANGCDDRIRKSCLGGRIRSQASLANGCDKMRTQENQKQTTPSLDASSIFFLFDKCQGCQRRYMKDSALLLVVFFSLATSRSNSGSGATFFELNPCRNLARPLPFLRSFFFLTQIPNKNKNMPRLAVVVAILLCATALAAPLPPGTSDLEQGKDGSPAPGTASDENTTDPTFQAGQDRTPPGSNKIIISVGPGIPLPPRPVKQLRAK